MHAKLLIVQLYCVYLQVCFHKKQKKNNNNNKKKHSCCRSMCYRIKLGRDGTIVSHLLQLTPSPEYPMLHEQLKLPKVFVQLAFPSQLSVPSRHSSISVNINKKQDFFITNIVTEKCKRSTYHIPVQLLKPSPE